MHYRFTDESARIEYQRDHEVTQLLYNAGAIAFLVDGTIATAVASHAVLTGLYLTISIIIGIMSLACMLSRPVVVSVRMRRHQVQDIIEEEYVEVFETEKHPVHT